MREILPALASLLYQSCETAHLARFSGQLSVTAFKTLPRHRDRGAVDGPPALCRICAERAPGRVAEDIRRGNPRTGNIMPGRGTLFPRSSPDTVRPHSISPHAPRSMLHAPCSRPPLVALHSQLQHRPAAGTSGALVERFSATSTSTRHPTQLYRLQTPGTILRPLSSPTAASSLI